MPPHFQARLGEPLRTDAPRYGYSCEDSVGSRLPSVCQARKRTPGAWWSQRCLRLAEFVALLLSGRGEVIGLLRTEQRGLASSNPGPATRRTGKQQREVQL